MKLSTLFLGRPVYWLIAVAVGGVLAWLGANQMHVRSFVPFQFAVLALAVAAVAAVVIVYRPGENVTREPIEQGLDETEE